MVQANTSTGVGTEHSEHFVSCLVFVRIVNLLSCTGQRVYCTSVIMSRDGLKKKKDLVETSAYNSDEASSLGDSSQLNITQLNITDLLKHVIMQDQRRTEKELRRAEQEKEDRETRELQQAEQQKSDRLAQE